MRAAASVSGAAESSTCSSRSSSARASLRATSMTSLRLPIRHPCGGHAVHRVVVRRVQRVLTGSSARARSARLEGRAGDCPQSRAMHPTADRVVAL